MKPITMEVKVQLAEANMNYSVIVQEENIQDVISNSNYLEENRKLIVDDFLALALYDCSKLIFQDIIQKVSNAAPHTNS